MFAAIFSLICLTAGAGQQFDKPAPVKSLLGRELPAFQFQEASKQRLEDNLAEAKKNYESDPNVENLIWLGRRTAYLWRYHEAIEIYSRGMNTFPRDPRLYRHRGHRWITVREFDKAIDDFERAVELIAGKQDEIEPDGQPNAKGIPTSTLFTNIYYHLGLAHYLKGNFDEAYQSYLRCYDLADNDDMRVAALDWIYMSLRRAGKHDKAQSMIESVTPEMEIIENVAYHRRLLMYKGEIALEELIDFESDDASRALDLATYGYAIGNWHLIHGDKEKAQKIFEQVMAGPYWAAFGYIAAEADLARMK